MTSVNTIRATAWASNLLYRHARPLYTALYDTYKRVTEGAALAVIARCVHPDDRVIDVGANIGFYSEVLARRVGAGGHVHAFEPDASNFATLAARARAYPQIEAVQAAVAERSGRIELFLSPHLNIDHRTYPTDEPRRQMTVDAIALDDFFAAAETVVHFVKIDIQGAERAALLGMRRLLARSPAVRILMELWPAVHDRFGGGAAALLELLESLGFEVWRLGPRGTLDEQLHPASELERADPDAYFDVLCVRPDIAPH